jgi:hypothetical protein
MLQLALILACSPAVRSAETMVIHEWGTFTVLQDDAGSAIAGINVDDVPVPDFVYDAMPGQLQALDDLSPALEAAHPQNKGIPPSANPLITMRLETPVIYVHPGANGAGQALDVQVVLHGGWLSQFFPQAVAAYPTRQVGRFIRPVPLSGSTISSLSWSGIRIGTPSDTAPASTDAVWTAPRQVSAAELGVGNQAERFLFYRGVAHLDAPVHVRRAADGRLSMSIDAGAGTIPHVQLVDIRPDGSVAYRRIEVSAAAVSDAGPERFADTDYSPGKRAALRQELAADLRRNGLFADEAEALLNTWDGSYFRSAGLRLFFIVPRAWVDTVLPMNVNLPASIERAMVGRIDLISPDKRALLHAIEQGPTSHPTWMADFLAQQVYQPDGKGGTALRPGGLPMLLKLSQPGGLQRIGIAVPPDYAAYLGLGRFRNALVLNACRDRTQAGLMAFAKVYGIL